MCINCIHLLSAGGVNWVCPVYSERWLTVRAIAPERIAQLRELAGEWKSLDEKGIGHV